VCVPWPYHISAAAGSPLVGNAARVKSTGSSFSPGEETPLFPMIIRSEAMLKCLVKNSLGAVLKNAKVCRATAKLLAA